MLQEFKQFVSRGQVMDLAVAVIIGGAFGKIVSSLVSDVIMPIVGRFTGGIDFTNLFVPLDGSEYETLEAAKEAGAATLNYGSFLQTVVDFLIIAFVIFLMIRWVNRVRKQFEEEKPEEEPAAPPEDIVLLREIRDALQKDS